MEYEQYFDVKNPKIKKIIDDYRRISGIYERLKAIIEPPTVKSSIAGGTMSVVFSRYGYTNSSTASVRF